MTRSRDSGSLVAGAAAPRDEGEGPEEAGARVEAVAVSAVPVSSPLDALFDYSLNLLVAMLTARSMTRLSLPDIKETFVAMKMNCEFEATRGTAGDLSSLFRDGPATLRRDSEGMLILEAAAGLRHLCLNFPVVRVRAGNYRTTGCIKAEASPASVRVQLLLEPTGEYHLASLRLAQLGRPRVEVKGLGRTRAALQPLLEGWIKARVGGDVERLVERQLNEQLRGGRSKL